MKIYLKKFPTHIKTSKTKFKKINGNLIWSTSNHFIRNMIKEEISKYILEELENIKSLEMKYPLRIRSKYFLPWNYHNVSMRKDKKGNKVISWNKDNNYDNNYKWDIGNLGYIWDKVFIDCLTKKKLIPDDSIRYVRSSGGVEFIPINNLSERKIIFEIEEY